VWPDVEYLEDVVSAETLEWCEILGASIGHLDPVDRRSLWGSELDVLQFGLVASAVV
jgi:hypothetical protein